MSVTVKDFLEVNQSWLLGRRVNWSAALDSEIEYKSPVTCEEEMMFVIVTEEDEITQPLMNPLL